jgi:hypothetical protein
MMVKNEETEDERNANKRKRKKQNSLIKDKYGNAATVVLWPSD